jgi:hypothetical protein
VLLGQLRVGGAHALDLFRWRLCWMLTHGVCP